MQRQDIAVIGGRRASAGLNLSRIVEAAWELVDEGGLEALSTRSLAAALGVRGPALYWHVASMQQLMGLMIKHALEDSVAFPHADLSWQEWLRAVSRAQRQALLAHRDSGRIASNLSPPDSMRTEIIPTVIAPLLEAGIEQRDAIAAAGALASFVLGWIIYEQRPQTRDLVAALVDIDYAFEFGLDALVIGLGAKAVQRNPSTAPHQFEQRN